MGWLKGMRVLVTAPVAPSSARSALAVPPVLLSAVVPLARV